MWRKFMGAGENIAWGQRSPEEVMNGWMNSSGHRANILNSSFKKIGVAYYVGANGRTYWTQLFTY
ncbi:MAG: CAP domain-containing protein [Eubacterium sp.]